MSSPRLPVCHNSHATKMLTSVAFERIKKLRMLKIKEVIKSLETQAVADADDVRSLGQELDKLRSAYQRYMQAVESKRTKETRVQRLVFALDQKIPADKCRELLSAGIF